MKTKLSVKVAYTKENRFSKPSSNELIHILSSGGEVWWSCCVRKMAEKIWQVVILSCTATQTATNDFNSNPFEHKMSLSFIVLIQCFAGRLSEGYCIAKPGPTRYQRSYPALPTLKVSIISICAHITVWYASQLSSSWAHWGMPRHVPTKAQNEYCSIAIVCTEWRSLLDTFVSQSFSLSYASADV